MRGPTAISMVVARPSAKYDDAPRDRQDAFYSVTYVSWDERSDDHFVRPSTLGRAGGLVTTNHARRMVGSLKLDLGSD